MPSNNPWRWAPLAVGLILAGCWTTQPVAIPVGSERLPPKPAGAIVEIFRDRAPDRPFKVVARLNVHLEKTAFIHSAFADARPELEKLARQSGADAISGIVEKSSRLNETFIYNVSADAIVFTR